MQRVIKLYTLVVVLFFAGHTYADDTSEVNTVFNEYLAALNTYDTEVMTSLMHPNALERLKNSFDSALEGSKSALAKREILPLLMLSDYTAYQVLSAREVFKQLNDAIAVSAPQMIEILKMSSFAVVSTEIKEGTAYVTYEMQLDYNGQSVTQQDVQKLMSYNGEWMLLLPSTAEATIANFAARYNP